MDYINIIPRLNWLGRFDEHPLSSSVEFANMLDLLFHLFFVPVKACRDMRYVNIKLL